VDFRACPYSLPHSQTPSNSSFADNHWAERRKLRGQCLLRLAGPSRLGPAETQIVVVNILTAGIRPFTIVGGSRPFQPSSPWLPTCRKPARERTPNEYRCQRLASSTHPAAKPAH